MTIALKKDIEAEFAKQILKDVSTGIALFDPKTYFMIWCNTAFKKRTWFGSVGRSAVSVNLVDLFDIKDHKLMFDLFEITLDLGQAYDFQRQVRRGTLGFFPAEIKLHRMLIEDKFLICMEILDLSITKMYDELQMKHTQVKEKIADLMSAQAELHYSVRMNTISEMGADLAHQIINPVSACLGLLQTYLSEDDIKSALKEDIKKIVEHLKEVQNLAVWFRKFSNPKLAEPQIMDLMEMINDALMLNVYRFTTQGITYKIRRSESYEPNVLINPANFIMWLNSVLIELSKIINPADGNIIFVDLNGNDLLASVNIQCLRSKEKMVEIDKQTVKKFADKLTGVAKFETLIQDDIVSFSLTLNCFQELSDPISTEIEINLEEINANKIELIPIKKPLILVIDDEEDIRKLIKRSMKQSKFECIEAEDGLQALEYFQKEDKKDIAERVAVIICDVRMPRMTGPHFLVALREEGIQIPFIFFSSNIVEKRNENFEYQNVFYLTKEAGLEELKNIVKRFVQ